MFVRVKSTPNSPRCSVQIVESTRQGKKVRQQLVKHVGIAQDEKNLEELKLLGEELIIQIEKERSGAFPIIAPEELAKLTYEGRNRRKEGRERQKGESEALEVDLRNLREKQRVIEGTTEVFGRVYEEMGFDEIFGETQAQRKSAEILKNCVLARLSNPGSKRRTASLLERDFAIRIALDKIYRMMDALVPRLDDIQKIAAAKASRLFGGKIDLLLYDVTTLHFESQQVDSLREFGYSKDGKFNEVQVVLALLTTREGIPLCYKLFGGSKAETKTLIESVEELKRDFEVSRTILVAGRGMFSKANLLSVEKKGWDYIIAAKLKSLKRELREQILLRAELERKSNSSESWALEFEVAPGQRLVVSYSADREERDRRLRAKALERLKKKQKANGKISSKSLIKNGAAKQYLKGSSGEDFELCQRKIEQEERWDGLHGCVTNNHSLGSKDVLASYSDLWKIEEAFKVNKHDLRIRPIFHWTEDRIRAHVAICFMCFCVAKHTEYRVRVQQEPLSFARIRNELLAVQASILKDSSTGKFYRMPSSMNTVAKKIYRCFSLERSEEAHQIPSYKIKSI